MSVLTLNDMPTPGPSLEIIDVDAFEDQGLNLNPISQEELPPSTQPVSRPLDRGSRRTTPQTIYLLDSDDDDLHVTSGSGINSNLGEFSFQPVVKRRVMECSITDTGRPFNSRRLLSPPPRNLPVTTIPPVPPVPPRFAGHTSFPMRFPSPPFPPPPVVRPASRPLPFENAFDGPIAGPSNHRLRRRNDSIPLQAAPPSHHVPSMGLGGAIISSRRLGNTSEPQRPRGSARRLRLPSLSGLVEYSRWTHRLVPSFLGDDTEMDDLFGDDDGGAMFAVWQDFDPTFRARRQAGTHEKDQYLPSYTHPSQPEPGFTFDFALPTSSGANTPFQTRLFPPTSINNPIVLDDDDDNSNESSTANAGPSHSPSTSDTGQVTATLVCANCSDLLLINAALLPDQNDRRVWGLRCGHIIDEKCLNQLGQPPQVDNNPPDPKGRGKGKATDSGPSYGDTIVSENQTVLEQVQENSIRSRLRTRPGPGFTSTILPSSPSSSLDLTPKRLPPFKRRRVSNKKKVEAEYSWSCPVANCGRVHMSVKVDGVWGPEKERESVGRTVGPGKPEARGAIPIFA